jgi:hypothetical protein
MLVPTLAHGTGTFSAMNEDQKQESPAAVREIVAAMVAQALARCDREGFAREDFYRALLEEQKLCPKVIVEELFERTFRRLAGMAS